MIRNISAIVRFELGNAFRRISTYIYFALFAGLACLIFLVAAGAFPGVDMGLGAGGKLLANSPFMLFVLVSSTSYYGLLVVAAIMGNAAQQDFRYNTFPLVFTAPVTKIQYLVGRFLAANIVLMVIFSSIGLACFLASFATVIDESFIGPHRVMAYLMPYCLAVIPNTFFIGAVFFGLAALTRNMLPVYVSAVVLFVGYLIAAVLASQLESKYIAGLIDPFGNYALEHVTQYWTVAEKNSKWIPISGLMLVNRIVWTLAGVGVLGLTGWFFRMEQGGDIRGLMRDEVPAGGPAIGNVAVPTVAVGTTSQAWLYPRLIWLEFRQIVFSVPFMLIVVCGIGFVLVSSTTLQAMYGTSVYPVTAVIAEIARGSFTLFMMIILIVYSGQLVWREREAGMQQLLDAQPVSTWLPLVTKTVALILIQAFLLLVVMLTGMAIQTGSGYFNYEVGVYLRDFFGIQLINLALMSIMAIFFQVVINHKYLAQFVTVLFLLGDVFFSSLGWRHHLYRYGRGPGYLYSDMNGFGHFMPGVTWFQIYWALFAMLLVIACRLMWVRSTESNLSVRFEEAQRRMSVATRAVVLTMMLAAVGVGVFIFHNTNRLNTYRTGGERRNISARYEKDYKSESEKAQPRVVGVEVNVDIFPENRRIHARGKYVLKNKTDAPISSVFVNLPTDDIEVKALKVGDVEEPATKDTRQGVYIFEFPEPLAADDATNLEFDLDFEFDGFKNSRGDTQVVFNGTFFNQGNLPQIGYMNARELTDDAVRKKYKLDPRPRMAGIDDLEARQNNYISNHADWIDFEATVSTSADQIAVAPGSLRREWSEGDRRYFHYKADGQILFFFSFLSARYEVMRDNWNDVALEIYYHPGHEYNLDSMMTAMKASLEYYSENFSPYQHKQARILEFPRYQSFAQSFPNTIPYSEAVGFIAEVDPDDEKDVDYPVYVTAHEIAHQWWAHQVIGGNVQGATLLSETLAQYSALMVMKQMFGAEQMKRFLRHELDLYLQGRSTERKKELALALVENQGYIHYNKGSLVMYALQDYIGEEAVNRALANFVKEIGFQEPPYTTSKELIAQFRKETPDDLQYIIDDLFETITLFDNRAVAASYRKLSDEEFEVTIEVTSKKFRADEQGAETEVPMRDQIDVGVLDSEGDFLLLEKRWVESEKSEFVVTVPERPAKAGIDPLNKLIDRQPDNNLVNVKKAK